MEDEDSVHVVIREPSSSDSSISEESTPIEDEFGNEEDSYDSEDGDAPIKQLSQFEIGIFEELSDDDFINLVSNVESEKRHLILENRVFQNFLLTNEPVLLSGLQQALNAIKELEQAQPLVPAGFQRPNASEIPQSAKVYMFSDKGNRINISQRTDLVLRDVEEMQIALDTFIEKAKRTKFKYKAEIEESTIRGEEVKDARELFEQSIVIDAVDPITQRIPAEKFVWYMQDWLKNARLITEKLRLRNNSLKIQYNKLKALLTQKIELGESIHEVDFEQLRIENKHLIEKIEQKNTHLIELKKINGKANLNLATHKNYLQKILEGLKTIKNAIDESQLQTRIHEQETEVAKKELNDAITKYNSVKDLIDHYKVPEVFDYVKVKGRLYDLKKSLKILSRRINITKIILNTNTKKMMKLTKEKRPLPHWFREQDETDDYDDLYDEDDYIYSNPKNMLSKDNRVSSEFDIFKALK